MQLIAKGLFLLTAIQFTIGDIYNVIIPTGNDNGRYAHSTTTVGSGQPFGVVYFSLDEFEAAYDRAKEETAVPISGTNDKAIAVRNGVLVFKENGTLANFTLPCTPSLSPGIGGENPSVVDIMCGHDIYQLFKYPNRDEYDIEHTYTLRSNYLSPTFVLYHRETAVAYVNSGAIFVLTPINADSTPRVQPPVVFLSTIGCTQFINMSGFTPHTVLVRCTNGYVVVNVDDGSYHTPNFPSNITRVYTHSSGLAVVTTPISYTVYHDTFSQRCPPIPLSPPNLLAVDFASSTDNVLPLLIFRDRVETINDCSKDTIISNISVSASPGHQFYDVHDNLIAVTNISRGLYYVTYYNISTPHNVVFHQASLNRPVVFTILNSTSAVVHPPKMPFTPASTSDDTPTNITSSDTFPTPTRTTTPTPTSPTASNRPTSTLTTPTAGNTETSAQQTQSPQEVLNDKRNEWYYYVVPAIFLALVGIVVVACVGVFCYKKLNEKVPPNSEMTNLREKGPICQERPDETSSSRMTTPSMERYEMQDGISACDEQREEIVV